MNPSSAELEFEFEIERDFGCEFAFERLKKVLSDTPPKPSPEGAPDPPQGSTLRHPEKRPNRS